ncbi:hypothetical protein S301_08550 [Salmonella enterica subsp. enterica]|uniref:Uncharacterized protein n=1 Tax=Salmonella enterica I TaxID=59201 RepID=A0A5U3EEK1_SALET|nr:hypothetical protein [Salmonella enterica subsp. enterica]
MITGSLSVSTTVNNIFEEQRIFSNKQGVVDLPERATDSTVTHITSEEVFRLLEENRCHIFYMKKRCEALRLEVDAVANAARSDISDSDETLAYFAGLLDSGANDLTTDISLLKLSYFRTLLSDAWKPYKEKFEKIGWEVIEACAETRNAYSDLAHAIRLHISHNSYDYEMNISTDEWKEYNQKSNAFFDSIGTQA